jgi:PIN domain nuclease of toxin-antitoxin system
MRYLLDTQLLLWSGEGSLRLSPLAVEIITTADNTIFFSPANIWEIAIKFAKGLKSFTANPVVVRYESLQHGLRELPIVSTHTMAVAELAPIHKDPFDRLLIAQAMVEGITLLTADAVIAQYPGPILKV